MTKHLEVATIGAVAVIGAALLAFTPLVRGQLATRVDDPLGLSMRVPRLQVVHAADDAVPGTSMWLQQHDPWLAYMMGRDLFEREWSTADGVYQRLPDRGAGGGGGIGGVNSCAMCHNLPFRSPGAGGNAGDPGFGRNAPHLFGIGLLETLAIQIRAEIFDRFDTNRNGFLDHPAETAGREAVVEAMPGAPVDFGALDDRDGDGQPDLNPVMRIVFVDRDGHALAAQDGVAPSLGDPRVAGYDFSTAFLGASISDHQFPTVRAFSIGVMETLMGIPSIDSTVSNDTGKGRDARAGDGWAETSNAGAPQLAFPLPDATKKCAERDHVSSGELDLLEWYMMNHPPPAQREETAGARHGRLLLASLGCTQCHVPDWAIHPADPSRGLPGDRRFFNLETKWNAAHGRLEGSLKTLSTSPRGGTVIRDVFTDLRHHDLGARFYEHTFDQGQLIVIKRFRTAPLWGAGSTAPYGHDGRSLALDDVIRRHGGEATDSALAYGAAPEGDRRDLWEFLNSLVLYSPDTLPADLDGDGSISIAFRRDGQDLGSERFWPELLFAAVPRYRGWTTASDGSRYFSFALLNLDELYGRNARALADSDANGVPDLVQCVSTRIDSPRDISREAGFNRRRRR